MDGLPDERLIADQIEYYSRRAPEYDATWPSPDDPLAQQCRRVAGVLDEFGPRGRVLEIAAGTGQWTKQLVSHAVEVTALDSSKEMLDLNARKVASPEVRYEVADIFKWTPSARYDVVFFGFWLSHVPESRFERFWEVVAASLEPEGRVFFVDEAHGGSGHEQPADEPDVVIRTLGDGSAHRAVKIFWEPSRLRARLDELGWDVAVESTGLLLWGQGTRRRRVAR